MKETKVTFNEDSGEMVDKKGNSYGAADWKDINGLLEVIDNDLKEHGLELLVGDHGDDNYWVCVAKREGK